MIRPEYAEMLRKTRDEWETRHGTAWGGSAVRNAGYQIVRYLNKHTHIETVLDFGCGTGSLGEHVRLHCNRPLVWIEYDPSIPGKDTLLRPERPFDLVITVDVLEHVEPCSLDRTLEWIRQNSMRQYHHIDCNETRDRLPDGRDVHLIIQEPDWWEQKLVPPAEGWIIMERHIHDKRKRGRFPRRSCTFVLERG